jgi:uncharacterized protein with NRDE domain
MCTVTYHPTDTGFYICSSRDEQIDRKKASPPVPIKHHGTALLTPIDQKAGGSWIAINQYGWVGVLLNGAKKKHLPLGPYQKSRGLIVLDILALENPQHGFQAIDLDNIEPFTLVLAKQQMLYACIWDGSNKLMEYPDTSEKHIWSSATLYDEAAKQKREDWFWNWSSKYAEVNSNAILDFHLHTGKEEPAIAIRMKRDETIATVSISCIKWENEKAVFDYYDLKENARFESNILFAIQELSIN